MSQSGPFWLWCCQIPLEPCTAGLWHCQSHHKITAVLQCLLASCTISVSVDGSALEACVRNGSDCPFFILSLPIALWKVYRVWDYVASMPLCLQFPFLYCLMSPLHQLFWRKVCAMKEDCLQCDILVQNPSECCACHTGLHAKWKRIHFFHIFTFSFHLHFFSDALMIFRLGHIVS